MKNNHLNKVCMSKDICKLMIKKKRYIIIPFEGISIFFMVSNVDTMTPPWTMRKIN